MNSHWTASRIARAALVLLVVTIAALAFVAALANAFDWNGWWVIAVVVTLAALTLVWKVWSDVIRPAREDRKAEQREHRHATALAVRLDRIHDDVTVWIENQGTHEVRRIEVIGTPVGDSGLLGPPFRPDEYEGITHHDAPGNDLYFEIEYIDPNRGLRLATYHEIEDLSFPEIGDLPTEIRFEVWWTDHEGRRRYSEGVSDLADAPDSIEMVPRDVTRR